MTTKELMLGDYITLADCFNDGKETLIFKVVGLGYDGENSALVLLNGEKACDIVEIDDEWCGIPITPEILEKNGFSNGKLNVSPQYCFEEGHTFVGVTLEATPDRQEGITVCKDRNSLQYEGKIKYVHELQHALRICGIDKEIEL